MTGIDATGEAREVAAEDLDQFIAEATRNRLFEAGGKEWQGFYQSVVRNLGG